MGVARLVRRRSFSVQGIIVGVSFEALHVQALITVIEDTVRYFTLDRCEKMWPRLHSENSMV